MRSDPTPGPPAPGERGRQGLIGLGLVLTFLALASLAVALPAAVTLSGSAFADLTVGAVGLLVGGGLLGYAAGRRRASRGSR
jgi:hypothetical protein